MRARLQPFFFSNCPSAVPLQGVEGHLLIPRSFALSLCGLTRIQRSLAWNWPSASVCCRIQSVIFVHANMVSRAITSFIVHTEFALWQSRGFVGAWGSGPLLIAIYAYHFISRPPRHNNEGQVALKTSPRPKRAASKQCYYFGCAGKASSLASPSCHCHRGS